MRRVFEYSSRILATASLFLEISFASLVLLLIFCPLLVFFCLFLEGGGGCFISYTCSLVSLYYVVSPSLSIVHIITLVLLCMVNGRKPLSVAPLGSVAPFIIGYQLWTLPLRVVCLIFSAPVFLKSELPCLYGENTS